VSTKIKKGKKKLKRGKKKRKRERESHCFVVYAEITGVVWVVPRRTITKSFFFFLRLHFSRRVEPFFLCVQDEEEEKRERCEEDEEKKSFICSRIFVFIYL
jgi:hypothetical protein